MKSEILIMQIFLSISQIKALGENHTVLHLYGIHNCMVSHVSDLFGLLRSMQEYTKCTEDFLRTSRLL